MSELIRTATKVADWFEAQAARDEAKAKTERFLTLRDAYIFDAKNYQAMARDLRQALTEERAAVSERDAEIARLTGLATYDHGHNEPCLMCGKPCNSLAGNPALWALRLGNDGWHHTGCVNDALRKLAQLRAGGITGHLSIPTRKRKQC